MAASLANRVPFAPYRDGATKQMAANAPARYREVKTPAAGAVLMLVEVGKHGRTAKATPAGPAGRSGRAGGGAAAGYDDRLRPRAVTGRAAAPARPR